MSEALGRELACTPVTVTETPGGGAEAGRKGARLRPAWENAVRRMEPGPTSGRAEAVPSNVAELEAAATLAKPTHCSL
jgi:hypothetical protein